MTSRDFIQAEAANTGRIVLYREGIFWKAYERSAFAVCSQIRPFKPTRRSLKTLGGGELVSIGFPVRTEDTVLAGLERLSVEPERLELRAASPIDVAQFEAWKASVPLAPSRPVRAAEPAPQSGAAGISASSSVSTCAVAAPASGAAGPSLSGGGTAAADDPAPAYAGIPAVQECDSPAGNVPSSPGCGADFTLTAACRVADSLRRFDLADKTPMECMLFVSRLKKMLADR